MPEPNFFGVGTHPDIPEALVHFTGRPRSDTDTPPDFAAGSAEDRLGLILQQGVLRGAQTWGTLGAVVCVSEPSAAALATMLSTGVTYRGAYAPWAVLIKRQALVDAGFRPVWHMSDDELAATNGQAGKFRDRRVRYVPGKVDWLAEREWRLCWGLKDAPQHPTFDLTGALAGVIVGESGWMPPPAVEHLGNATWTKYAKSCHEVPRLWWDGQQLVDDGVFDLERQMHEAWMYGHGLM